MNKFKIALIVVLGIVAFSACEKDDICVDGDTPLLVLRFYDKDDTTEVKAVSDLEVKGLNGTEALAAIPNASADSIVIPLRADTGTTSFSLSRNLTPTDENTANIDTITFNYETREIFVSRACGFIVNYDGLNGSTASDADVWIDEIRIVTPLVENSSSAHVKILH